MKKMAAVGMAVAMALAAPALIVAAEEGKAEEKKAEEKKAEAAPAAEPSGAKGWFKAGHEKMDSGDLSGAVEAFMKAKEACRPDNKKDRAWAMNNVGLCHIRASKWDEARAALEEATGLDEGNHKAWNNLGTVLLTMKDHAKAASAFESAVKAKPDEAKYKANLAYAKGLMEGGESAAKKDEAPAKSEAAPAEGKKP